MNAWKRLNIIENHTCREEAARKNDRVKSWVPDADAHLSGVRAAIFSHGNFSFASRSTESGKEGLVLVAVYDHPYHYLILPNMMYVVNIWIRCFCSCCFLQFINVRASFAIRIKTKFCKKNLPHKLLDQSRGNILINRLRHQSHLLNMLGISPRMNLNLGVILLFKFLCTLIDGYI